MDGQAFLIFTILLIVMIWFFYEPFMSINRQTSKKETKTSNNKINKNKSSSGSSNYGYGILRFVVVAIALQIGREFELDKQLGGILTALITLLAFVWIFRGKRLFTYRFGQNIWESEKNKPKDNTSTRKKESDTDSLEDISKEKATKEIKELRELLDSGIISKTEYNKKAKELKKIILK